MLWVSYFGSFNCRLGLKSVLSCYSTYLQYFVFLRLLRYLLSVCSSVCDASWIGSPQFKGPEGTAIRVAGLCHANILSFPRLDATSEWWPYSDLGRTYCKARGKRVRPGVREHRLFISTEKTPVRECNCFLSILSIFPFHNLRASPLQLAGECSQPMRVRASSSELGPGRKRETVSRDRSPKRESPRRSHP